MNLFLDLGEESARLRKIKLKTPDEVARATQIDSALGRYRQPQIGTKDIIRTTTLPLSQTHAIRAIKVRLREALQTKNVQELDRAVKEIQPEIGYLMAKRDIAQRNLTIYNDQWTKAKSPSEKAIYKAVHDLEQKRIRDYVRDLENVQKEIVDIRAACTPTP